VKGERLVEGEKRNSYHMQLTFWKLAAIARVIYLFITHNCSIIKSTHNTHTHTYTVIKSIPDSPYNVHSQTQLIFDSVLWAKTNMYS